MVGKKKIALLLCAVLVGTGLVGCGEKKEEAKKKIGIIQWVQHPALDDANRGFIDGLKEKGFEDGKNIEIDFQNAQAKNDIAQTISSQFVNGKKDLIFANATPAAQAAYNATNVPSEKNPIPIVITSVTDPVEAKIAKSMKKSETNVTGTSDMVPIDVQIDMLIKLVPTVKKLGVVYDTSQINSQIQVKQLKEVAAKKNIEVKEIGVANVNEINQNLPVGLNGLDALYAPTDNTVASAYDLVAKLTLDKKIPLFCAEEGGVSKGGLITLGINYYDLGKEAGYKAAEILGGKKATDIEITTLSKMSVIINQDAAAKLGIKIPDDIKANAKIVTGGVN